MVIFYILLIAYILAVNFYAFLLVKSLRDKERLEETYRQAAPLVEETPKQPERFVGKLLITGLLGGAISIYASMFFLKFRRGDMLLMILTPLLGVLNIYFWVLLFKSGFSFFIIR